MTDNTSWCTIESDPGVFTELIESFGVSGVQVEEMFEVDESLYEDFKPIYGLIFLFKYLPSKDDRPISEAPDVYFAQQVIPNACATQALISILMNCKDISLGKELTEFKEFTKDLPAELKGLALDNRDTIKKAHNSFSRPDSISVSNPNAPGEDPMHFIAYVPIDGVLYELDGLKAGPIRLGECDENWLKAAAPVIRKRIDLYATSENSFALLALVKNRKMVYKEQIDALKVEKESLENNMNYDDHIDLIKSIQERIEHLEGNVANEEAKFQNWKAENIRRRHNYVPFLFNLLKILAEKDILMPLVEKAKENKKGNQNQ